MSGKMADSVNKREKAQDPKKGGFSGLSSGALKIIACVCMLIDHITLCFIPEPDRLKVILDTEEIVWYVGRGIGRSALIIFCFLLVEGFFLTGDYKKYLIRMLVTAVVSEAAFDLMFKRLNAESFLTNQNVLFSFALGLMLMYVLEFLKDAYFYKSVVKYSILAALTCSFGFAAAALLRLDYGMPGIGLILVFYYFRFRGWRLVLAVVIWSIVCLFMNHQLEWAGLIALIPIMKFYNGTEGKLPKWFFYIFYPAHMLVLGLMRI